MKVETPAEQLLFATLRIEGDSSIGTGFIVEHEWSEGQRGPFLVTNKHVVLGATRGRITFTEQDSAGEVPGPALTRTTTVEIAQDGWRWTGHRSQDVDIAVMPLGPVINELNSRGKTIFYRSIPTTLIPSQEILDDLDAVEEVLFLGYPNNVYDRVNNLPIARKGITATPPSVNYEGKPVFLVDASVFPGSSGSPVLLYNVGMWAGRKGTTVGNRILLLGVLAAVLFREQDGSLEFEEIPTTVTPIVRTKEMIDLGIVYKAHTIVEAIELLLRERGVLS